MTEDAALQFVKQEPVEILHIKQEVDIKQEALEPRIKREHDNLGTVLRIAPTYHVLILMALESEPQPSKEFMAAFNRLETARHGRGELYLRSSLQRPCWNVLQSRLQSVSQVRHLNPRRNFWLHFNVWSKHKQPWPMASITHVCAQHAR